MNTTQLQPLRIAITADLHYGPRHPAGRESTLKLVAKLAETPPDILIIAGDIGAGEEFESCLKLFDNIPSLKALVPGNHDIWVRQLDKRGDSLDLYDSVLPQICREHGFVYLDQNPIMLKESSLGIVGSMNWYDYTWEKERIRTTIADWEERLRTKRFHRGQHNDVNFVRWPMNDIEFTSRSVAKLAEQITNTCREVSKTLVITHHPPLRGLLYPAMEPLSADALLWRAFSGNERMEQLLIANGRRIPFVFCGHTHSARECEIEGVRGYNIGGDYQFKRLLWLNWPEGTIEPEEFHA